MKRKLVLTLSVLGFFLAAMAQQSRMMVNYFNVACEKSLTDKEWISLQRSIYSVAGIYHISNLEKEHKLVICTKAAITEQQIRSLLLTQSSNPISTQTVNEDAAVVERLALERNQFKKTLGQ
ncbi:MAG: hypothetical protein U0T84_04745 [Chitinophagales bacterium]